MKIKFLYLVAFMMVAMIYSCDEINDFYDVKIINNSAEDISVYYTLISSPEPWGPSITISKGECFEYTLSVDKESRDRAYVTYLFSDKEIDIENEVPNQEPSHIETSKFVFLKYSLWELKQMNCTITFNGFENE